MIVRQYQAAGHNTEAHCSMKVSSLHLEHGCSGPEHAACRLTVYPETMGEGERWLDSSGGGGGRASVHAAVLRAADGSGYARGSDWCPGLDAAAAPAPEAVPILGTSGTAAQAGYSNAAAGQEEPGSTAMDASSRDAGTPHCSAIPSKETHMQLRCSHSAACRSDLCRPQCIGPTAVCQL